MVILPDRAIYSPDRLPNADSYADIYLNSHVQRAQVYQHTQFHPEKNIFGVLDKEGHRRKRKIYSQILSDRSLRTFEPIMAMEIKIFLKNLLAFQVEPLNMAPVCQKVAADISGHLAFGQSLHTQTEATNRRLVDAMASVNGIINLFSQFTSVKHPTLFI